MKIHFFQRYHSKENVDTANTMLLLSRLYSYDSAKFFAFLAKLLPENATVGLYISLQEKANSSVPDATISQSSFKIVVETKLYSNFDLLQLKCHLQSFKNEDYKVLLTLDPNKLTEKMKNDIERMVSEYNKNSNNNIIHKHLSFEELINEIRVIIDERDYEINDILDDYQEYCYMGELIPDDWKRMRVQLAGNTIDINKKLKLYYEDAARGFSGHKYLGLYNQKAVRAIGEIKAKITAVYRGTELIFQIEEGDLTEDMKERIKIAIEDSKNYGYNLVDITHRYFFVENFYDTHYEKETPYAPMGTRFFNLCEVLDTKKLPPLEEIAKLLEKKTWQ
ncbi:MAG: hypothetical protein A2Y25_02100 [Candidatus Melainabacteria bacterium GWF2_37_15]|nr:MAG: hypothetical protein A2Y25_02100 [Candidatus Melainabacteria bacterium GWF2_37_15]